MSPRFTVATDEPESDGTFRCSTRLGLVEAHARGMMRLGYSYAHASAAALIPRRSRQRGPGSRRSGGSRLLRGDVALRPRRSVSSGSVRSPIATDAEALPNLLLKTQQRYASRAHELRRCA
jgi:hypothetical protein